MEKLLNELLSGEGKLSLLLLKAKDYAEDAKDESLTVFINKELNGYSRSDLPEYRKIQGQIIGDIKNSYGQLQNREYNLDFSVLSEHMGLDLSIVYIPDGIVFIEENLTDLTGQNVLRPIHPKMVKMLNETFHLNNPDLNLVSASHKFGKASIKFLLSKVRQELIIGLQKLVKQNKSEVKNILDINTGDNLKKVFVTYAWENEDKNNKVISFVEFLRKKGYDASMDKKEAQEQTAIDFNQMMLEHIQNSDKVIIILSKMYKEKADKFEGGVGFEYKIIIEELKRHTNKFIFVSFGFDDLNEIKPTGISGREVTDLKKDQDENNFNYLFSKLDSKTLIKFSEVNETKVEVKAIDIKPFKL